MLDNKVEDDDNRVNTLEAQGKIYLFSKSLLFVPLS